MRAGPPIGGLNQQGTAPISHLIRTRHSMALRAACLGRPLPQDYKPRGVTHRGPDANIHSGSCPSNFALLINGTGIIRRANYLKIK